jgi:hypothetical protein
MRKIGRYTVLKWDLMSRQHGKYPVMLCLSGKMPQTQNVTFQETKGESKFTLRKHPPLPLQPGVDIKFRK